MADAGNDREPPHDEDAYSPLHRSNLRRNLVALAAVVLVVGGGLTATAMLHDAPSDEEVAACALLERLLGGEDLAASSSEMLSTLGDIGAHARRAGNHLMAAAADDAQRSLNLAQAQGAVAERDTHVVLFRTAMADLRDACAGVR